MKKLLSLAALALMLCVVACQNGGYKISGTVNGSQDGDTVVLVSMDFDTLQTTVIKDGAFCFTGTQDTAQLSYVLWKSNDNPDLSIGAIIALENAAISIQLDSDEDVPSEVSGTPANDALTAMNKQEHAFNEESQNYMNILADTSATEEAQQQARQQLEGMQNKMINYFKQLVAENIQNVVGQTFLVQLASALEDDFVNEQLKAIPENALTSELQELKKTYEQKASTAVGQPFKDFQAETPEGGKLSISEVAAGAKVLLVDFWASWCGPCRQEMPNVKAAYEKFHAQGFEILGVSLDESAEAWKKAIEDLGMTWPQISDLRGWNCEGASLYTIRAIPATVLIKDGVIVARDLRGEELTKKIEELLK